MRFLSVLGLGRDVTYDFTPFNTTLQEKNGASTLEAS